LKTVKGISDFDIWLEKLRARTRDLGFTEAFGVVAEIARETYGMRLWFVEMLGRRRSYIAGEHGNEPTTSSVIPFHLDDRIAVLSDSWGFLPKNAQARLVAFLRDVVHLKHRNGQSKADRRSPQG
jgi:hypothetical protein